MSTKRQAVLFSVCCILLSLCLAACQQALRPDEDAPSPAVSNPAAPDREAKTLESIEEVPAAEPITFYVSTGDSLPSIDPQVVGEAGGIEVVENLFLQLVNYAPGSTEIVPEAAVSWEVDDKELTYTFNLRKDIPWVQRDPETGAITQVVDENGNPRFVTAEDFVYAFQRACDPAVGAYFGIIILPFVEGCEAAILWEGEGERPQALIDAIGVEAPADDRLVIHVTQPVGFFMNIMPMSGTSAVPRWAIEEYGDRWTEPENLVTNGRFVLEDWIHGRNRSIVRNPLLPADMRGRGNLERVEFQVVPDGSTAYALWVDGQLDIARIPTEQALNHIDRFPDEITPIPHSSTMYFGFRATKPPFDDVRVRRAFSAAFDRQAFTDVVLLGTAEPMIHFAPPAMFGAPPIDEVGVGFDPVYARTQLAEAGYPNCEGLPLITVVSYADAEVQTFLEFAQSNWVEHLGCDPDQIRLEQEEFYVLLETTARGAPDEIAPHVYFFGWGADYPDENNWVGDVLWCKLPGERSGRDCSEVDDLIVQARETLDPERRIALYREIEERFFGREGEFPIAPIFSDLFFTAEHAWVDSPPQQVAAGTGWYDIIIDQQAQLMARNR